VSSPDAWARGHDFTQGGAACLASYRVESARHFGGLNRLCYRQSEYCNDRGICSLDELKAGRILQARCNGLVLETPAIPRRRTPGGLSAIRKLCNCSRNNRRQTHHFEANLPAIADQLGRTCQP
jgi:hypothetical protein